MLKRKTTINLDPDLVKRARVYAALSSNGNDYISLGVVIEKALEKLLSSESTLKTR